MRRAARPSSWQRRRAARGRPAAAPAAASDASGAPGLQHAGGDAERAGGGVGCAAGACNGPGRPADAAALPAALGLHAYPPAGIGQAADTVTGSAAGTRHGPGGLPGGRACAPMGPPGADPCPAGSGGGARALDGRGGRGPPAASRRASQRAPRGWAAPADVRLPRQRIFHTARFSAKTGLPAGRARPAACQSCLCACPHGWAPVHKRALVESEAVSLV